ncbi:hypothetical protein [Actinacidiphila glaucinigra]|uniref:hypothetical protein n=1 Tax=Actinacidiphila glaucinigra TaxID=235986 RepID=UPI0036720C4B
MVEDTLDRVEVGPSGVPYAYGMNGRPITTRQAAFLLGDLNRRTLHWTPVRLPGGVPAEVRTVCSVFDDDAATEHVPQGYVPQVFASNLYTPAPESRFLVQLWTYGSPAEANAGHREAVEEFLSGRARAA